MAMVIGISLANPVFLAAMVPIFAAYWVIQQSYIRTSRQLKRLESVARSPMYSFFSETLSGISSIRAYNVQQEFMDDFQTKVEFGHVAYQLNLASNRWLSIRLEMLGNAIILAACLLIVAYRETQNAGIVGLALTYALQVTGTLSVFLTQASQFETNMVCLERMKEYQDELPLEASQILPDHDPPSSWPQRGSIVLENCQTRYRDGLDLVLRGLTCEILVRQQ